MLTLDEIETLLRANEIEWRSALSEVMELCDKRRLWLSKTWLTKREQFLEAQCVQCGSDAPPLVVQHLVHPSSFGQIFRALCGRDAWSTFKREWDAVIGHDLLVNKEVCPQCESPHGKRLKTILVWSCYKCGTKSPEPKIAAVFTQDGLQCLRQRRKMSEIERWRTFQERYGPKVGAAAVLETIRQFRSYADFDSAVTFCKKCAFLWDKKGLRRCSRCKEHWHSILRASCRHCIRAT